MSVKDRIKRFLESKGIRLNLVKNLWYSDSFIIIKKLCKTQAPLIFDIGACDGSSVVDYKKIFPQSIIYSFEPFPDSFENLEKLSTAYKNVYPFKLALSDSNGEVTFFVNKSKATNSLLKAVNTSSFIDEHIVLENIVQVESRQLDVFVSASKIDFIDILKIDVQGGELKVFEGARSLLQDKKIGLIYIEVWFIEGYENQPLYSDIAGFLKKYSYVTFGIYNMHYREDGHFLWGDAIFYLK